MDKFMRLVRYYVNAGFTYLSQHAWDAELLKAYLELMEAVPLSVANAKVSDGLRYHVLDTWVEELDGVDVGREGVCPVERVMGPVQKLEKEGKTKKIRERARECLSDERLKDWSSGGRNEAGEESGADDNAGNDEGEGWGE
ncbi:hypothetical protein MMC30_002213 [Trapelia coarctata]|nr:hypothetical protein [Trapelia coarctata]